MKQSPISLIILAILISSPHLCNGAAKKESPTALTLIENIVYSRDSGAPQANTDIFNPGRRSLSAGLRGAAISCPELRAEIVSCYANPDCAQYCCIACGFGTTIYHYFSTFNPGETDSLLYLPEPNTFIPVLAGLGCALCDQLVRTKKPSWCSSLTKFICGLNGISDEGHEE